MEEIKRFFVSEGGKSSVITQKTLHNVYYEFVIFINP
jgi:hypothetical protein